MATPKRFVDPVWYAWTALHRVAPPAELECRAPADDAELLEMRVDDPKRLARNRYQREYQARRREQLRAALAAA